MAAPAVRAVGAWVANTTAITVVPSASHVTDDVELLFVENSGEAAATLTTAEGFASVGTINQGGVGPSGSVAQLTVFWRRWNGTDGSPVVADVGNHQQGRIISFSGVVTTGTPYEAVTTSAEVADTSGSITGGTSTVADTMIVAAIAASLPDLDTTAEYSAWTNANLTSITEQIDNTTLAGNGGGLGVATGVMATAGAWGATTVTLATSAAKAMMSLALMPAGGGGVAIAGTSAGTSTSALALSQARPIAGVSASTSTSAVILTVLSAGGLAGTSNGVSTSVLKLVVTYQLAGVSDAVSTSQAALSQARPIDGLSAAISTSELNLGQAYNLPAMSSNGVSTSVMRLFIPGNWQVYINSVDRTSYVRPFDAVRIVNRIHAGSGTATIPIRDDSGALTITTEMEVDIVERGTRLFRGLVRSISRNDRGWSTGPRVYTLECQDFTTLLDDDVIESAFRTTTESDKSRITWLVNTFGTRGVIAGAEIQTLVATMPPGGPELDFSGLTLREAIEQVTALTGGSYYVDYTKRLHYFLTESGAAPYGLSDAYNGTTTVGYNSLELDDDSIDQRHEVLVVGTDIKAWYDVTDFGLGSLPALGVRRRGKLEDSNVTTAAQASDAAKAYLTRNSAVRDSGSVNTLAAGFRAGQIVNITHTGMGLSSTPFTIAAVTASTLSGEEVNFALELNDPKIDLADLVLANRKRLDTIRRYNQSNTDENGEPIGGRNLILNSSFENGDTAGWSVGTGWTFGFAVSDAYHKAKTARLVRSAATSGDLSTPSIGVDRDSLYGISFKTFMRSRSSGTARFELREYNSGGTLLATTTLTDISAAETKWTKYEHRFGGRQTSNTTAFHASTASIRLVARTTGTATLTLDTDAWQIEDGKVTAYRPMPAEVGDGAIGNDQIGDGAIGGEKIVDLSITETKISSGAISTPKLQANAVDANAIAANAITAGKIQANAVTAAAIQADAITSAKIAAGAVTATEIATNAITAGKIAANAITTINLVAGQVTIKNSNGTVILDGTGDPVLQIFAQWSISMGAASGAGTTVARMNLSGWPYGYPPFLIGMVNAGGGKSILMPYEQPNVSTGVMNTYFYAYSTSSFVECVRVTRLASPSVSFRLLALIQGSTNG